VPLDHYTTLHIVSDFDARLNALGEPHAFVVGHNWAATAAWDLCLFRPDRVLLWGTCLGFERLLQLLTEDEEATIMEEFDAENYLMNLGFTNPAWRIERNDLAIQLFNYFGRYFISKCKHNKNHFESLEAEDHMLLHNWYVLPCSNSLFRGCGHLIRFYLGDDHLRQWRWCLTLLQHGENVQILSRRHHSQDQTLSHHHHPGTYKHFRDQVQA
jgi:pimeloyl-ACP methyl ester carboxylesterase